MSEELIELGRAKRCEPGEIRRRGYTTRHGVRVPSTCVKDVGKKGKTPPSEKVLPKPKAGKLQGWSHDLPATERHRILRRVAKKHGCKDAILDLNLLANYTKRTDPTTHKKARADMKWLHKQDWCALKTKKGK
jgi:hypothetical protein